MMLVDNLILEIQNQNSLVLYHYSTKPLNFIYSRNKQDSLGINPISKEDRIRIKLHDKKNAFPYYDHISLFLDPIPLDLIRQHFTTNQVYQSKELFEHHIKVEQLKNNLNYFDLKENPINNFFVMNLGWFFDHFEETFFSTRKFLNNLIGYTGSDYSQLIKVISKFKGVTTKAFEKLINDYGLDERSKKCTLLWFHIYKYGLKMVN